MCLDKFIVETTVTLDMHLLQCLLLGGGEKRVKAGEWQGKFLVVPLTFQDATTNNPSSQNMLQIPGYCVKDTVSGY